jgi:hypothetical protein
MHYTGGHMLLTDSFTSSQFKQSFVRVFDKDAADNLDNMAIVGSAFSESIIELESN